MSNKKFTKMKSDQHMADVLYQKLGNNWYAFAEIDGEMYMTPLKEDEIEAKIEEQEDFFLDSLSDGNPSSKKTPQVA